jgi:small subunit ribosomal protein S6
MLLNLKFKNIININMNLYEFTYLISPELSKEEIKSLQEKIKSLVIKEKGVLGKINPPVRKRLAFKIKKEKEAFLDTITFSLDSENLKKIEKELKQQKQILRYLLFKKNLMKKRAKFTARTKVKPKTKVELKEIEKKLDEILNE